MSVETLNNQTNEISKDLKDLKEEIDYTNPTPEMNTKEIMSLSNEEIINIISKFINDREKGFDHKDKNWMYTIINGKKVYLCDNEHLPERNWTYIRYEFNRTWYFSLFTKEWNKYRWIYYNDEDRYDNKKIHKWKLTFKKDTDFGIRITWN